MFTNNKKENENNGHGRKERVPLTRMTEMGVEVIDAPPTVAEERVEDELMKQNASAEEDVNLIDESHQPKAQSLLNEDDAPPSAELVSREEKRDTKKRIMIAASIIALLLILTMLLYFWLVDPAKNGMAYQVKSNEAARDSTTSQEQSRGITAEEIARELGKPDAAQSEAASEGSSSSNSSDKRLSAQSSSSSPITDRLPVDDYSTTVNPGQSVTQTTATQVATNSATNQVSATSTGAASAATETQTMTDSRSTIERSIRISGLQTKTQEANSSSQNSSSSRSANTTLATNVANAVDASTIEETQGLRGIPLPPLGTMLPVRTLGAVFTLRTDSYVRMQLTRDVAGRGWSLPRGTEFYGVVRGADIETGRAYMTMIGFVDVHTNRLVRLQGNLLGGDGADGVRGIKHKLNSGWLRALKAAGAGLVDALSTIAAGIGRRPVLVGDIYGSGMTRSMSPIAQEISGLSSGNGRRASGFVEVPAGTSCYLLVMTSPREIEGVDADVNLPDASELERLSDARRSRQQSHMSEEELAELITDGSPNEIRRALPRMSPEMRRVAEAFLVSR